MVCAGSEHTFYSIFCFARTQEFKVAAGGQSGNYKERAGHMSSSCCCVSYNLTFLLLLTHLSLALSLSLHYLQELVCYYFCL